MRDKKLYDKEYYIRNKEKISRRGAEYYQKNKEKLKAYSRKWSKDNYEKNRERISITHKANYLKNRPANLKWHKEHWASMRKELIDFMGGKCLFCGFTDIRALQIDHVNGGGRQETKSNGSLKSPRHYQEHIQKNRANYQLLCANCNWIKKHENQEVSKTKIIIPT